MYGYVKNGDEGYLVIELGKDESGEYIIPEGALTTPPPKLEHENQYVTIENGQWVVGQYTFTEEERYTNELRLKLAQLESWEPRYLNRYFIYDGNIYKCDARFREMLNSAIGAYNEWGQLPNFWVTSTMDLIEPVTKEFLDGIGKTSYDFHQESLLTAFKINKQIRTAKTASELEKVEFPPIETLEEMIELLEKEKK